ncbi:peptide-methionine (S)-S-oxide reductase MsrA [Sediminispirochaeta smaragdinae]|jgi:peptide-methionine (S)-S-oxide reductase|uniref:Peptide methionine sulfoxide reductase MsrA n=1 Tax=Sediminispirochaeta smaragdinae (strain DSM 11293 / JCM 15392 / SEBR 4228) TaxID=573413 RepID=E1RAW8_SEDSS|nr:peptide-methionine (S)-S-oxide reductase MsrA [Sediminispirochaeta smaragdinae]ADK79498.1 peptide methionine sulfoxide reductase [Sediminispirochaeta smaragdinae DSM 11293]
MREEVIVLGGGCFWCMEAIFRRVEGVLRVTNGYAGGRDPEPTYEKVSSGTTGYAEVVEIRFDADRLSLKDLLELFWKAHDPTTRDRQGADIGSQYRSVIFFTEPHQQIIARESMQELHDLGHYENPIVTELLPLSQFHPAEAYHQDYYARNSFAPYCRMVIAPKLNKLEANGTGS